MLDYRIATKLVRLKNNFFAIFAALNKLEFLGLRDFQIQLLYIPSSTLNDDEKRRTLMYIDVIFSVFLLSALISTSQMKI